MKRISAIFICCAVLLPSARLTAAEAAEKPPSPPTVSEGLEIGEDAYPSMLEFLSALAILRSHYVDKEKVSYKNLFDAALRGLMHELDPFSNFESQDSLKSLQEETEGKFAGIGIMLSNRNNIVEITAVVPDGPADKAGIKPGDLLLEIDGKALTGPDMQESIGQIRGAPGTPIQLTVYRGADDKRHSFELKREVIRRSSVMGAAPVDKESGVCYLRISQFGVDTAADLDKAMNSLESQGMRALIIDLRDNPGGLLDAAGAVSSRFIEEGKPVVSIEDRNDKTVAINSVRVRKKWMDLPIAILVNGNSASASEIFTGCLQDYKRAVVIGEKTFGKASVQTVIPFAGKTALRITTARYYTPENRKIHGIGLTPDILVPLSPAQRFMISSQLNTNPGVVKPQTIQSIRDIQLERALQVLNGVMIFRKDAEKKQEQGTPE